MDASEAVANTFLLRLGFADIQYEPDGKRPPDFSVNDSIGIEVRRLNQNVRSAKGFKGLEEDARPLWDGIEKLAKSLGPSPPDENWYVNFSFRRPFGRRKQIGDHVRAALSEFVSTKERQPTHWQLTPGFRLEVIKGGTKHPTFFTMGGYVDYDDGGWVLSEMQRNLDICIAEKTIKRRNARKEYTEWWLILLDHIGYGLPDEEDRDQLRSLVSKSADWNRVVLLNSLDVRCFFELHKTAGFPLALTSETPQTAYPESAH